MTARHRVPRRSPGGRSPGGRSAAVGIGIALLAVLSADISAAVVARPAGGTAPPAVAPTAPPTLPPTAPPTPRTAAPVPAKPPAAPAFVADLRAFVERERGLRFRRPVTVSLLDDADYVRRVRAAAAEPPRPGAGADTGTVRNDMSVTLTVLRLLEPGVDLAAETRELVGSSTSGFYDPRTRTISVRGRMPTPLVRLTIVHELVHALQDQWFGIDRPALDDRDDEAGLAFTALVEGDAIRIEDAYYKSLDRTQQQAADDEQRERYGGDREPDVPEALSALFGFPYDVGPAFVQALLLRGGQTRLDAAFRSPPTTSKQLLNAASYLDGQPPVAAPQTPPSVGTTLDSGTLGQLGLILVLSESQTDETAIAGAAGWNGDRYVTYRRGAGACTRVSLALEPELLPQAVDTLRAWAARHGSATVKGSGPVTVVACRDTV